jgi:hypothetical protein
MSVYIKKSEREGWVWWHTSIIPATQEVETGQSEQKLVEPIFKNKLGMVAHACNPGYSWATVRRIMVQGQLWQKAQDPT